MVRELECFELRFLLAADTDLTLLDVREDHERAENSIGGLHIPLASLRGRLAEIPCDFRIVVYCASGLRSRQAALFLQETLPGMDIHVLRGGLAAFMRPQLSQA